MHSFPLSMSRPAPNSTRRRLGMPRTSIDIAPGHRDPKGGEWAQEGRVGRGGGSFAEEWTAEREVKQGSIKRAQTLWLLVERGQLEGLSRCGYKAESSGSKQEAHRWGRGMLSRCTRKNAGRGPGRGRFSNCSLPGWPASRGLEGRAAGDWERWDLRLQERREQREGHRWKGIGIRGKSLVIPRARKVFSLRHMTPSTHSAHPITDFPFMERPLSTIPPDFCKLCGQCPHRPAD